MSKQHEVQTHNTDLKKRLGAYAQQYPDLCRQTDDDGQGGLTLEIEKGRLSFRLTAPYSEEREQGQRVGKGAGDTGRKIMGLEGGDLRNCRPLKAITVLCRNLSVPAKNMVVYKT